MAVRNSCAMLWELRLFEAWHCHTPLNEHSRIQKASESLGPTQYPTVLLRHGGNINSIDGHNLLSCSEFLVSRREFVFQKLWPAAASTGSQSALSCARGLHSSKLTWNWRVAHCKTTILSGGPSMSFLVDLGEGNYLTSTLKPTFGTTAKPASEPP